MNIEIVKTQAPRRRPEHGKLGFGTNFSDHVFSMQWKEDSGWHSPRIEAYGPIALEPAASVLHYAQAIFEGLKAHRATNGEVRLFRPERHAARFERSAKRLCMPPVPNDIFLEAIKELVKVDEDWVPESRDGSSLYIRPVVIADEAFLGVRPSRSYRFMVITSPVGAYYAEGFNPVKIRVERTRVRAARGGVGEAKTAGNYAASLLAAKQAKEAGYAQVLWTDAAKHELIEEVGTMNVFFHIGDEVVTPSLEGSILPGVTRASVIELLRHRGVNVVERGVKLSEVIHAHEKGELFEAFGTGTAAVISPIATLGLNGGSKDLVISGGKVGPMAESLFAQITGMQRGEVADTFGWLVPVH